MRSTRRVGAKDQPKAKETCYFCSRGILEEKRVTVDFRWGEKLVIIENVPARVCNECGERYYAARVVRQMEPRQTRFNCCENQGVAPGREYATRPACA